MPKNKELKGIPPSFKSRYTYNTIDIYKTHKVYVSLDELFTEANSDKVHELRAHMVRGHFKHMRGGMYWWNSFIRNRKANNGERLIQKDYRLKDVGDVS